ncbi:MAG TPA: hypothetical protein VID76_09370 [Solirubrobacterales bacterium]
MLAPVIAGASALILVAGAGTSFTADELNYVGRVADLATPAVDYHSLTLEYVLAPHNGHLQPAGKLIYEAMFAAFGTDYAAFRVLEVLVVMLCVGLFFELARARIGDPAALLLATLLAFLGAAWEVMIWAFDLHTVGSLAAGLGALLAFERGGRRADLVACVLLIASVALVEVGLAFIAGIAVGILIAPDRWRRIWVVAIPAVLFAAWYAWALQYDLNGITSGGLGSLIPSVIDSLGGVLVALTGTFAPATGIATRFVVQDPLATVLAIVVVCLLGFRAFRGGIPRTIWPPLTALLVYWALIGLADRPADSSRYVFVGAVLLLLVAGDALRRIKPTTLAIAALAVLVAIALPANIARLFDGGDSLADESALTRSEFAMLELAGANADPAYVSAYDPAAHAVGAPPLVISPSVYAETARRIGSLASSLEQVQDADVTARRVDDVVLVGALDIDLEPSPAPQSEGSCRDLPEAPGAVALPPGGALVSAASSDPAAIGLARFVVESPSAQLGSAEPGEWSELRIPSDDRAATLPWRMFYDHPLRICPLG